MKNTYEFNVHEGEMTHSIRLKFKDIRDSRRLPAYLHGKAPNLFRISGAIECRMDAAPGVFQHRWNPGLDFEMRFGMSLCYFRDKWNPCKGRLEALKSCLEDVHPHLRAELIETFMGMQDARQKEKGPDRIPRTAKTKPRRKSMRALLANTIARVTELEQKGALSL